MLGRPGLDVWLVMNLVALSCAVIAAQNNVDAGSLTTQEGSQTTSIYATGSGPHDGDLRLVEGPSTLEGRLEVFYNGTFGLVCDDSRYGPQQQGLTGGVGGGGAATSTTSTSSGGSSGPAGSGVLPGAPAAFHLDEVVCAGSEASLAACEHNAWGFHDCGSGEAVAVRGSDRTGNCTDVGPVYFYYGGGTTEVEYRVLYRYANGAHSCPAPLTVNASADEYQFSMVAWVMDRAVPPPPGRHAFMVQRRGHIGKLYNVGPAWLKDLWIDVMETVDDGSLELVESMDRTMGYDPTTGKLDVAGPAIAGWRWRHGSVGLTSLYVPETFPELTAASGAGINATYQLVYEMSSTQATTDFLAYSYPGSLRFTVHHARSSPPLLIYVQLESVVHPATLSALLLQRVEGDSVWTVARLPPESDALKLQQQTLLFRDETNIQGWGPSNASSSSNTSAQQQAAAHAYSCSLLLRGCSNQTSPRSAGATAAPGAPPCFAAAELHCTWAVAPNGTQGAATAGAQDVWDWGISILGQAAESVKLQHSWISDLPLSPAGPLVECRECASVTFLNVTLQDLLGGVAQAADNNTSASDSSSGTLVQQQPAAVGAVLVTGVRDVHMEGCTCQRVTGATGWGCLAVELAAEASAAAGTEGSDYSLTLEDTRVLDNTMALLSSGGGTMSLLSDVDGATGAVVVLLRNATQAAAVDIRVRRSDLSRNSGGTGSVLFLGPGLEGDIALVSTSVGCNTASGHGGAFCTMGFLRKLELTQGSSLDGNSALNHKGGVIYAPLGYGLLSLDKSSASDNIAAEGGVLASGMAAGDVTVTSGSRMDNNTAQQACSIVCGWVATGLPPAHYVGANVTVRASSISHSKGGWRVFSFFMMWSLVVADSVMDGSNVSFVHVGWYPETPGYDRSVHSVHIERSRFVNGHDLFSGAITDFSVNVFELRIIDSVIDRNSVTGASVVITGYYYGSIVFRNTSISDNMINRTDASWGAVLSGIAAAGDITFEDVVMRNNTGGRYGGFSMAYLRSLTIRGPRTVMEDFAKGFFYVEQNVEAITIADGALVRNNIDTSGVRSGGFIQIAQNAGDITIDNATLLDSMAGIAGGFITIGNDVLGSIRISNAHIEGHTAGNGAGGFMAVGGSVQGVVEINNSRICNCQAKTSGGALYVQSGVFGGIFLGAGATLCGNKAVTGSGGAIAGGFTVPVVAVSDGAQLLENEAEVDGGAVWSSGLIGNITISAGGAFAAGFIGGVELRDGGEAVGNTAGVDGGLAWADRLTSFWLRGGSATSNTAGAGGAISVSIPVPGSPLLSQVVPSGQALVNITGGSVFSGNYAYMDGGVISIAAEERGNAIDAVSNAPRIQLSVHMEASTFLINTAGGAGGALFVSAPALGAVRVAITASKCRFTRNTAGSSVFERGSTTDSGCGGAVAATSTPNLLVSGCVFEDNVALSNGGAVSVVSCPARVDRSSFARNAGKSGGGLSSRVESQEAVSATPATTEQQQQQTRRRAQQQQVLLQKPSESNPWLQVWDSNFANNTATGPCGGGVHVEFGRGESARIARCYFSGNAAPLAGSGGAVCLQALGSSGRAEDSSISGSSAAQGGAVYAQCRCMARAGSGGGLYLAAGTTARVRDCAFTANTASASGGGVRGTDCARLSLERVSVRGGSADQLGGGVASTCAELLVLNGSSIVNNSALTGGGLALSGPAAAATADGTSSRPATVTITDATIAANSASPLAAGGSGSNSSSTGGRQAVYVRYGGHGGGAFVAGNVSVLLRDVDMSVGNLAVTGSAVASTQQGCLPGAAGGDDACAQQLVLQDVRLPAQETPSVWLQDTSARALRVNCSGLARLSNVPAPAVQAPCTAAAAADTSSSNGTAASDQLLRACLLEQQLGQCVVAPTVELVRDQISPATFSALSLLDAPPTHMRLVSGLQSSDGWLELSAGTAFQLAVQIFNSLSQPLHTDTMEWSIAVSIRPLRLPTNNATSIERPWNDPNLANLDPDPAAGGSLTANVVGGVATWPRLKVRGWVGPYELIFRAFSPSDATLYQVSDLAVRARILPCLEGEALDLSWAQQSWGQPSWVSCARCSGGTFTLWRDTRPALSDVDSPNYMQQMKELSQHAAASQAACQRCPNNAICPGGRVVVPNPGYWHSAPDSALLHRCPQQAACGNPVDANRWPDVQRALSTAASTLISANASLSTTLGALSTLSSSNGLDGPGYDARSEWLIACQQLRGSLAVAGGDTVAAACGGSSNDTAGGGGYLGLQCAEGYAGNLCATCTPGYFLDSELSCSPCPSLGYTIVIAILALIGTTMLILYTSYVTFEEQIILSRTASNSLHKPNEKETSAADILKVLIVHVQFYVIVTRLAIPYPDSVSRLAAVTTAITGSENAFVYSHACFVPRLNPEWQARSQLAGALITPVLVLSLSLLIWLLRQVPVPVCRTVAKCLAHAPSRNANRLQLTHSFSSSGGGLEPRSSAAAAPAFRQPSPGTTIDEEPLATPTGSVVSALYTAAASVAAADPSQRLQTMQSLQHQPHFTLSSRFSEGGGGSTLGSAAVAQRAVGGLLSTAASLRLIVATDGTGVVDFADEDDCTDEAPEPPAAPQTEPIPEPLAGATPSSVPFDDPRSHGCSSSGETADEHTRSGSHAQSARGAKDADAAPPLSAASSMQRRRTQDAAASVAATQRDLRMSANGMLPASAFALAQAPSLRGRLSLLRSKDSRPQTPRAPLATSPSLRPVGSGKLQTALSNISRISVVAGISESFQKSGVRRLLSQLDASLKLGEQLLVVLMIGVFIVYPGWANAALSVFTCYIIDDGSTGLFPERQQATWPYGYWIRDHNLQCYNGTHLRVYVPVGVVAFVVLCLAPPVASFVILWRRRKQLTEPQVQLRYGFLYSRYKRRFWYWGSVQMVQQLLLVAVEMFGRALTQVDQQIAVLLVTFTLMALVNMACSPAKSRLLTLLDFFSLAVLILTLSLSLFFVTEAPLERSQADAVGVLIIAINAALLLSFAALLLRRTWMALQDKLDQRLRKVWRRVATFNSVREGAQEVCVEALPPHGGHQHQRDPDGGGTQAAAASAAVGAPPPPLQPAASGPLLPQSHSLASPAAAVAAQAAVASPAAAAGGRTREGPLLPLPPSALPGRLKPGPQPLAQPPLQALFRQAGSDGARARPADQDPTPFALLQQMDSMF
eukprot:XP_001702595.1 predicted protein [Chlamydomonas reinhardtii]